MSAVTSLSARDLEDVLDVVAEAAAADGETPFEPPLIERLTRLVPADHGGYYEYAAGGRSVFQVESTGVWSDDDVQCWAARVAEHLPHWPLNDGYVAGIPTAVKLSDFLTGRAKRRNPWYAEVMRPGLQEHECKLVLPGPSDPRLGFRMRGFFLVRGPGRRDFDERDRAVLGVLRTQLAAIRDRWERRRRPSGLTAREVEIVRLLRAGLTNQEIADRLVISTGTVRTHLEHLFAKLDVHTRTAAVARAFGPAGPGEP